MQRNINALQELSNCREEIATMADYQAERISPRSWYDRKVSSLTFKIRPKSLDLVNSTYWKPVCDVDT